MMWSYQADRIVYEDFRPKACCKNPSLQIVEKTVEPSDITCIICFQIFKNPRVMICKHSFCEPCIQDWGKCQSTTCPYCRTELKRVKSSFGKIDRKTINKIERATLRCRSCLWRGTSNQFTESFQQNPMLDQDVTLCGKNNQFGQNNICDGGDGQKRQVCPSNGEMEKQEYNPTKQSLDQILSADHKKVMHLIQNDSIFIEDNIPAEIIDMEKELQQSREKGWEDLLFDNDDMLF